jgi:hypothetical protein
LVGWFFLISGVGIGFVGWKERLLEGGWEIAKLGLKFISRREVAIECDLSNFGSMVRSYYRGFEMRGENLSLNLLIDHLEESR